MAEKIINQLVSIGLEEPTAVAAYRIGVILVAILLAALAFFIARKVLVVVIIQFVRRTSSKWDDMLLERNFFNRLANLAPAIVIYQMAPLIFFDLTTLARVVEQFALVYMVIAGLLVVDSLLNGALDIYRSYDVSRRVPLKGFIQIAKIFLFLFGFLMVLALLLEEPPWKFLSGLGALTAVLMLIFKDAILGFVAGIQLTTNDMVRVGDWIEMSQYGADGDVIDVSLTTVKVQNWDKTISMIPSYALVSDSFRNWRGMSDSGGRRIKRALYIDMTSIRFLDESMLERLKKVQFIQEYLDHKVQEVAEHNKEKEVDESSLVNGRRLTNVGTFRAYIEAYLRQHPKVHQNMTFLVRQLPPGETGLPIEIYVFSNDQVWAHYEAIQADIFDHLLAVVPEFGLQVFQRPSGQDVRSLAAAAAAGE